MSTSLARPCGVRMMFDGLMSRWTTPRRDAWTRALAICSATSTASPDRQRAGRLHPLADRHALDVFEGDVMEHAVLADAEDPGDVLVVELGGRSALLVESLDDLGVDGLVGGEQLEGDLAVELGIQGTEDRPHPPDADGLLEPECADHLAGPRQRDRSRGRRPGRSAGACASCPTPEHGRRSDPDPARRPRTRHSSRGRAGWLPRGSGATRGSTSTHAQWFGVRPLSTHPCQALDQDPVRR